MDEANNIKENNVYQIQEELVEKDNYLNFIVEEKDDKKNTKKKNNKKIIIISIILVFAVSIFSFIYIKEYSATLLKINDIKLVNYDKENEKINVEVNISNNIFNKSVSCYFFDTLTNNEKHILASDNKCIAELEITDYQISLNENRENFCLLSNEIGKNLEIALKENKVYLAKGGTYKISYNVVSIGTPAKINFISQDEKIATVNDNGEITGLSSGTTKIVLKDENLNEAILELVVTDLINTPHWNNNKKYLGCNVYNLEQSQLLDEILFDRIDKAGYKTRAGAVAAARFLTLEFPYKIDYFFENGRVNDSGSHYADGEGRYYHRGLYLHESKFKDIKYTFAGPVIWGCPLTNYEDFGKYVKYNKMPNGLDCSGFVTWALLNGGFDVGDYGAGETPAPNQMTDLGERVKVTRELVLSNKIKAGDLVNWWGHIGIIIGIDNNNYYVAESLDTYEGLVVKTYKKSNFHNDWTFVMLMDSVYLEDGNYTSMWN